MKNLILAIDIGTSGCKVCIFDREGSVIGSKTGSYHVFYPYEGWAEQDPEEWWKVVSRTVQDLMDETGTDPNMIAGIGIDGQSWSAIPIDSSGEVLANTPIWMDMRAKDICTRLNEKIGEDAIFEVAGNILQPSYSTAKVLWYRENIPEAYSRIDKILQSNSYIVYKLTGQLSTDRSQGYGMHCYDMRTGTWNMDMARALGVEEHLLTDLADSDQVVGYVTREAAVLCGLAEGTPVVAGCLDAAAGTLGCGVVRNGETQEQGGQAGGMSICIDSYNADKRLILSTYMVPGTWILQGGTTGGGGVMRWFEQEFAGLERMVGKEEGKSSFEYLNIMADEIPAGSEGLIFLPYMNGERTPIWNPNAKGVFYGLDFAKTRSHMMRACMEGVAYSVRHNLETAEKAGAGVSVLRAMGGSANSLVWTQIKSDITGKPIVVPSSDTATCLGAAITAGVGVGLYRDYEEAVSLTVQETRYHEPNPVSKEIYDRGYEMYIQIYEHLKDLMK